MKRVAIIRIMIALLCLVASHQAFSQALVVQLDGLLSERKPYDVAPYIQTIKSPPPIAIDQPIPLFQVQSVYSNSEWSPLKDISFLPRVELEGRWFRIDLNSSKASDVWLDIKHLQYPSLKAWQIEDQRVTRSLLLQSLSDDDELLQIRYPAVDINLQPNKVVSVLFYVSGRTGAFSQSLSVWEKKNRLVSLSKTNRLRWAFYGALLAMAAYNLLFSIIAKDRAYAFYAFWMIAMTGLFAVQTSYLFPVSLETGSVNPRRLVLLVSFGVMYFSFAQFSSDFLRLQDNYRRLYKALLLSSVSIILLIIFAFLAPTAHFFELLAITFFVFLVGLFVSVWGISFYLWSNGERIARSFFLSLTPFLIFVFWAALSRILGSDYSSPLESHFHWASIFLVIMLSVAFADRENLFREKERNAQASNQAKSDFLAKMSHEIRTPLNAVLGMSVLMKDTRLNHQQKNYNETIHRSAAALLSVINDILDYSKIEAGKMKVENAPYDLLELLREVGVLFQYQALQKEVDFVVDCEINTPLLIYGDKERLRQVLVNLLGNAVKFTDTGYVMLCVRKRNNAIQFVVKDTGIGISRQDQQQLFNYFQQADVSTSRRYGGTGLGLVICRELCTLMGGEVGLSSEPGVGTVIEVTLPLFDNESLPNTLNTIDKLPILEREFVFIEDSEYLQVAFSLFTASNQKVTWVSIEKAINLLKSNQRCNSIFVFDGCAIGDEKMNQLNDVFSQSSERSSDVYWLDSLFMEHSSIKKQWKDKVKIIDRSALVLDGICSIYQDQGSLCKLQTFTGTLPRAQPEKKLNILVAEDNVVNQTVIKGLLTKLGHDVSVVSNGALVVEAYMAYQKSTTSLSRVDLILMDCEMPEMDGYEATEKIRFWEESRGLSAVTIIALTAHVMPEYLQRCLDSGMDDYLLKPVDLDVVQDTLEKHSHHNKGSK